MHYSDGKRVTKSACLVAAVLLLGAAAVFAQEKAAKKPPEKPTGLAVTPEQMKRGEAVFKRTCIACHQPDGKGLPNVFPPLAQSDFLLSHFDNAIVGMIQGRQGPITVNGVTYNSLMPPQMLNAQEMADVLTYVLNSWGNKGGAISVERVKKVQESLKKK